MGGARATAEALIKRGIEHEQEFDVRAALRCYEVRGICGIYMRMQASAARLSTFDSHLYFSR